MKWYDWALISLVLIGALNWGLIGFANFNLVEWALATRPAVIKIVYDAVGISALVSIIRLFINNS